MARLDRQRKTVALKCVYWGPEGSGKTTNLATLHARYPEARRGRLVKLDTDREEAHFFEYFPAFLGRIDGWEVRVDFVAAPGRPELTSTRRAITEDADGVVFVADSAPGRRQDNLDALAELRASLTAAKRKVGLVFQWNRRDRQRRLAVSELEALLNPDRAPSQTAIATHGDGVWETHRLILRAMLSALRAALPEAVAASADEDTFELGLDVALAPRPRSGAATRAVVSTDRDAAGERQRIEARVGGPESAAEPTAQDEAARALALEKGVIGAFVADPSGGLLAAHGPVDARRMAGATVMAQRALGDALAAVGAGAPIRWSADIAGVGWHVAHRGEELVVACGLVTPLAGEVLARLYGPGGKA